MNPNIKVSFFRVKPLCDSIMVNPAPETLTQLHSALKTVPKEDLCELQLYILFPIAIHLKSEELGKKHEVQRHLVDVMKSVIERVVIISPEMFIKYHSCLLSLVFDKSQPGMVAQVPEELKLSVTESLTATILNMKKDARLKLFQNYVPLLAQTLFVSVHIAKLAQLRALRLSAINCVQAYTSTHPHFNNVGSSNPEELEAAAIDMMSTILPGVVSALQDVATNNDNVGHAVIVSALNTIHVMVCLVMNDKYLTLKSNVTTEDFIKMFQDIARIEDLKEGRKKEKPIKGVAKKSPEWFAMAGDKLMLVTKSLMPLQTHEHVKVRKELAVFSSRILLTCSRTMQPSLPLIIDALIALSKDEYPNVSKICTQTLQTYFNNIPAETKYRTLDSLADSFLTNLQALPRILNNIDSGRKLSSLNLLHGYLTIMCEGDRPQHLTKVLSLQNSLQTLCHALVEAVRLDTDINLLTLTNVRYLEPISSNKSSWCKLKHIDDRTCELRLADICRLLGNAECVDLIVDQLLDLFHDSSSDRKEVVYILNYIASAAHSSKALVQRILNAYIEPDVWYVPIDIMYYEAPPTSEETLDVDVYNPRAWEKDSVPGLYEGAVEIRYTDISYRTPRRQDVRDPNHCSTLLEAQNNLVVSCCLTQGVGILAITLREDYHAFLLRTLCLVLERVGSKYEMIHQAGLQAITDIAKACGHSDVRDLIRHNADYFTYQVTTRLKKAWDSQSALQILTVVMEYSDVTMFHCLYGIVSDVLVQSCDKYHGKDLSVYLQVFLTFVTCIQKWFPHNDILKKDTKTEQYLDNDYNFLKDLEEYIHSKEETDKLLNEECEEEPKRSTEEMYREDDLEQKMKEDDLDYNDRVTEEKSPPPHHIAMTVTILRRCLNFIPSKRRDEKLLAMQILDSGLKILKNHEDELLPIVHLIWSPLVGRFAEINEPIVLRRALELLVTMAAVSKDFIRNRTIKEVLPNLYKFLKDSSKNSRLKDVGSAYRDSQAYKLQVAALSALPTLVVDLNLEDTLLEDAMDSVLIYLSNKQPKPLQELSVRFFKETLEHDYGATWQRLRELCNNTCVIQQPMSCGALLEPIVGTPYHSVDLTYSHSVQQIFSDYLC